MDVDKPNHHMAANTSNPVIPITPISPISSTPKPEKVKKFKKPNKSSKTGSKANQSLGLSPCPSTSSSKRNRSTDQTTGFTPESKKAGLGDEALEAFGDFSSSSGLNDSLDELESAIVQNRAGLKRNLTRGPESTEDPPPPVKEIKMAKRTGIEIRFFKKEGIYQYGLSIEEWTKVKDQVQEQMFDKGLLEAFGRIVSTPFNGRGALAYGAITFKSVTDAEELLAHLNHFVFGLPISMQLIKPCRYVVKFRVYGMLTVDPKKIINAMLKLNNFTGNYVEVNASSIPEIVPDCRQFVLIPDDKLLEEFRALEANGSRIKTGFNSTIFRITENKNQE